MAKCGISVSSELTKTNYFHQTLEKGKMSPIIVLNLIMSHIQLIIACQVF